MARPRTKGDPIQFRLALDDDELFRAKAAEAGVSVSEWAEMVARRYCETQTGGESSSPYALELPPERIAEMRQAVDDAKMERQCRHKWVQGSSGLITCSKCSAVKR